MLLSELIAADGITLTADVSEGGWRRTYQGVFHFEGRTLEHDWSVDITDTSEVDAASLLSTAVHYSATAEASDDFEEYADDMDMEPSEENRKTYTMWLEVAKSLRSFLGDERYERYAYEAERDV